MSKLVALIVSLLLAVTLASRERERPEGQHPDPKSSIHVGFAETDITPDVGAGKKHVYLAGFGKNRVATGVHDPILARAVVLRDGSQKIALVSLDLVGLFHERIEAMRKRLPDFAYVLVSCTHNHEGPDTMGLWGPSFFQSGIEPDYMRFVEKRVVEAVELADKNARPALGRIGSVKIPELLHDARLPIVKHDELVALEFRNAKDEKLGVIVQWNCHPETLDDKNTQVSADFVATTVRHVRARQKCPVIYFTGTVGGLMTSLHVSVRDSEGQELKDGTFAKTERFGLLVGEAANRALARCQPLKLSPMKVARRELFLPTDNPMFLLGFRLGVLERSGFVWQGDPNRAEPLRDKKIPEGKKLCVRSELAWLRLGELDIAAIPGEIYPELVLGKVQDPVDPGADFRGAAIEPAIYAQLEGPYRMIIGLACDEIGYIIPKRQWDEKAPFCYGRRKSQYGEVNSLGPDTAPLLCDAFRKLVRGD